MFWSVDDFCDGFLKLIDHLELDKVSKRTRLYDFVHMQSLLWSFYLTDACAPQGK